MNLWERIRAAVALWIVLVLIAGFLDIFIRSESLEDLLFGSVIFHALAASALFVLAPYFVKLLGITVNGEASPAHSKVDAEESRAAPDKLSFALISILVLLLAAAWSFGIPLGPAPRGFGPVFMGLFLVVLGFMFLASYFYHEKSFFLRWLIRFSRGWPGYPNPKMAFFFSFISLLCGLGAITDGLGWFFL